MKPVKIRDENVDFTKPIDWDEDRDGKCSTLSVRREVVRNRPYHFSNWRPDAAELARLNAGGVVELCCVGSQPPVSISVVPGV